jgi:hypothetical protein
MQHFTTNFDALITAALALSKVHQHAIVGRELLEHLNGGGRANCAVAREFAGGFLHPSHARYSPKLAAAFAARQALEDDPTLLKYKSPKAAAKIWLRLHALEYGLIRANGHVNELAVEEIAKIVNWLQSGGAPKTPSRK